MDTSDYVTERVLFMECEDRWWKPVVFLSKSLNETERNYEIHNISSNKGAGKLKISFGKHKIQVQGLDRS